MGKAKCARGIYKHSKEPEYKLCLNCILLTLFTLVLDHLTYPKPTGNSYTDCPQICLLKYQMYTLGGTVRLIGYKGNAQNCYLCSK